MLKPATESKREASTPAQPELRVFRPDNPYVALGLAVSHLMIKPAFAALRFGEWSRILVGQINRKHYYFVIDAKNQVQGFLGWAVTSKDKAEAWVQGRGGLSYDEGRFDGSSIIFNVWAASNGEVNRFLLQEARKVIVGKEMVYFKRHYKDGSTRPMRLRVNDFVALHLQQKMAITTALSGTLGTAMTSPMAARAPTRSISTARPHPSS
jgi:hemolysin-activating ACP:hemolysin acyltransferase